MARAHLASEGPHDRAVGPGRFAMGNRGIRKSSGRAAVLTAIFVLLGVVILLPSRALARSSPAAQVSIGIAVRFGPPPLPVYAQPYCPGPGYIWTPGYWAWDPDYGYYWVPGTWVLAPFPGALWTPGYWGWDPVEAVFIWHDGYWGPRVGFYGGINYGFGYFGEGYEGGYWRDNRFFYNRAVNNINVVNITNVYNKTVVVNRVTRVSYNGGQGGIDARPSPEDLAAERERRMGAISTQLNHERMARQMPAMRWSENHGRPDVAATPRPGMFRGSGISRATRAGGPYSPEQPARSAPARPSQPRRFGEPSGNAQPSVRQPGGEQPSGGMRPFGRQPEGQPNYRPPERRNQPSPNENRPPMPRNQGQPQYGGPPREGGQPQAPRGRGNENRGQGQDQGRPSGQERGKHGPPPR